MRPPGVNGQFILQVIGHPSYGLPWGQDRLVPIFLATQAIRQKSPQIMFESAAEMLSTFGMQQGGRNIVAWLRRSRESSVRPSFSGPILSRSERWSFIARDSTS